MVGRLVGRVAVATLRRHSCRKELSSDLPEINLQLELLALAWSPPLTRSDFGPRISAQTWAQDGKRTSKRYSSRYLEERLGQGELQLALSRSKARQAHLALALSLQDVAESVGIANLPDEVATALAGDVEYRLWEIIEVRLALLLQLLGAQADRLHRTGVD